MALYTTAQIILLTQYCSGGVPAKEIRKRFPDEICCRLNATEWWDYSPDILFGLSIDRPEKCIDELEQVLLSSERYTPPIVKADVGGCGECFIEED